MKIFRFIVICTFFFSISFNTVYAQVKDNFVNDTILSKKLRKYLIENLNLYTIDSAGKKRPLDEKFIQEEYGSSMITTKNLKTDSILLDKNLIGVYSCRFADISSKPQLYFQYPTGITFIDLDTSNFNLDKLLRKAMIFFNKHPNQFTLKEKLKTIQGMMETIYYNKYAEYSW